MDRNAQHNLEQILLNFNRPVADIENLLKSLGKGCHSLKNTVLRRIPTILCSNPTLPRFVADANLKSSNKMELESELHDKVLQLLSELSLPKTTEVELFKIMKPICREIAKWLNFHENFLESSRGYLHNLPIERYLCWSRMNTVDYRKTATELIRHEALAIEQLYKLACLYCLDDCIQDLWEKIPSGRKSCFYCHESPLDVKQPKIVVFWTYMLKGEIDKLNRFMRRGRNSYTSIYQHAFEMAAESGYKPATEYFFQKLDVIQRDMTLFNAAFNVASLRNFDECSYVCEYQKFSDVLFHLLSVMRKKERDHLIRFRSFEILKCCLDWPRQDIFVDLAKIAFPYLNEEKYSRLVFILSQNIASGYNYQEIFRELFLISPVKFKNYTRVQYGYFLREFAVAEAVETIKFIFRNIDAADRLNLFLSYSGQNAVYEIAKAKKLHMLNVFVKESMSSREDVIKFKTAHLKRWHHL